MTRYQTVFFAAALGYALVQPAAVSAQKADFLASGAPPGSHRAAQDEALTLTLSPDFLEKHQGVVVETEADPKAPTPLASEIEKPGVPRADLSRQLDQDWDLNPILLNRSQAGEPPRPEDDLRQETIGIEIQKRF